MRNSHETANKYITSCLTNVLILAKGGTVPLNYELNYGPQSIRADPV